MPPLDTEPTCQVAMLWPEHNAPCDHAPTVRVWVAHTGLIDRPCDPFATLLCTTHLAALIEQVTECAGRSRCERCRMSVRRVSQVVHEIRPLTPGRWT